MVGIFCDKGCEFSLRIDPQQACLLSKAVCSPGAGKGMSIFRVVRWDPLFCAPLPPFLGTY